MRNAGLHTELLPALFRQEYSRMTAILCRHLGLPYIEIAEDIVSDAFLKAAEWWPLQGVPDNPEAWLYTVARNKARDYLKRQQIFDKRVRGAVRLEEGVLDDDLAFTPQLIADSQLAMIFAVCNPANAAASQICLALQVLCDFSLQEIANAFLTSVETVKKRLLRARAKLRTNAFTIGCLKDDVIVQRLDTVLRTIYLLFNKGHGSIRKDVCFEAVRLALLLTEYPLTNTTQTNALLALMYFQSSRLDARAGNILFEQQDKSLWSQALIDEGNYYLVNACCGDEISKYHLEAGIAYWHTTAAADKWTHILHLYNQLVVIEYSPVTALNRTFAFARVYGYEAGIVEAEKLQLSGHALYRDLVAYLYAQVPVAAGRSS